MENELELRRIKPYTVPQSHLEYLNTLSDELKSALNGTFIGTQFPPVFVPTTEKPVYEVKEIDGNIVLTFPKEVPCSDKVNFGRDVVGYVLANEDLATEFSDLSYSIALAIEKAKFDIPLLDVDHYKKMVFDVPSIVPIFSEEVVEFTVQGDVYNPVRYISTSPVTGFELVGDLEGLVHREVKSLYRSDSSMNSLMLQVISDLGVKAIGTYVVAEEAAAVEAEFRVRLEEFGSNAKSTIDALAMELGLEIVVDVIGFKVHPSIVMKEDGFEFAYRPKSRYHSLESMVEWIKEFDEDEARDSYAYQQAYMSYMASALPKV